MGYQFKLLKEPAVAALRRAEFPEVIVRFFDSVTGMAHALNNSANPVKSANTMMNRPKKPGNKYSFAEMLERFLARQHEKINGVADVPDDVAALLDEYTGNGPMTEEDTERIEAERKMAEETALFGPFGPPQHSQEDDQ